MLGTLLDKLSGLLSTGRVLSSLIPLTLFVMAVTVLVAHVDARYAKATRLFVAESASAGTVAMTSAAALAMLSIAAFVLSTINTLLREVMEGRYWPRAIASAFVTKQRDALVNVNATISRLRAERRTIESGSWIAELRAARLVRPKMATCTYSSRTAVSQRIAQLRGQRARGHEIAVSDLQSASADLSHELSRQPIRKADLCGQHLDRDQVDLAGLIRYASGWRRREVLRLYNERQVRFGVGGDEEPAILAPTSIGNLAEALRTYADTRYQMAFDVFWPRLQKILLKDKEFYAVLQDAKVQVDFFVSLFWLAGVFTLFSFVYLTVIAHTIGVYIVAVLGGLLVCTLSYQLTLVNYRGFTELVRAALDLHRMSLLAALHVERPASTLHEEAVWDALNRRISYGESFELPFDDAEPR